jgi:fluoroquinolone transport system permease protein
MAALSRVLGWEIALQARSFIYPATVVSTLMICGFIVVLPVDQLSVSWAVFFIFMDPAMIGFSFVGAIILMEKAEGTIAAVGVSPMQPDLYIAVKIISLTLVTFASGVVVAYVAADDFALLRMLSVLTLSSVVAVLIGFVVAARAPSMNKLTITLLWTSMIAYLLVWVVLGWLWAKREYTANIVTEGR